MWIFGAKGQLLDLHGAIVFFYKMKRILSREIKTIAEKYEVWVGFTKYDHKKHHKQPKVAALSLRQQTKIKQRPQN